MIEKIILKKSAVENKMPTTEQLEYGEIALNFNTMNPFISFKDTADGIRQIKDYSNEIQNINGSLTDAKNEINYLRPLVTDNHTNLMFLRGDFEDFKADNTKTINTLDRNVSQNGSAIATLSTSVDKKVSKTDIVQSTGTSETAVMSQKAVNDALSTKVGKTDITQSTGTSETAVMSQKAVSDALSNVYTKSESDARYLRGDWELISEVSEYDTSKNKITVAENCDGYKELAVRRTNNNTLSNTNVYLDVNGYSISLQGLSSQKKDAVWHVVQDGNNLSVKFLSYNFVNTGHRFYYPSSTNEYYINCKIGGKVELNFYTLKTLHDGENIKVYGKR